jgi:hypothetical protein
MHDVHMQPRGVMGIEVVFLVHTHRVVGLHVALPGCIVTAACWESSAAGPG